MANRLRSRFERLLMVTIKAIDGFWHAACVIAPGELLDLTVEQAAGVITSKKAVALDPAAYQAALIELQHATLGYCARIRGRRREIRDGGWRCDDAEPTASLLSFPRRRIELGHRGGAVSKLFHRGAPGQVVTHARARIAAARLLAYGHRPETAIERTSARDDERSTDRQVLCGTRPGWKRSGRFLGGLP